MTGRKDSEVAVVIESVDKALQILNLLAAKGSLKVNEVARELGMTPSTASRLLSTLARRCYVTRDKETKDYKIGYGAAQLGFAFLKQIEIRDIARSYLKRLAQETEETALLAIPNGLNVTCIDKIDGPHAVRTHASWGETIPLYCGSAGKVLLAFFPSEQIDRLILRFKFQRFTPNTIQSEAELRAELDRIRRRGYSTSIEEFNRGGAGVAAPVFNHEGQVIAALSVGGPVSRLYPKKMQLFGTLVKQAADELSRELGYADAGKPVTGRL